MARGWCVLWSGGLCAGLIEKRELVLTSQFENAVFSIKQQPKCSWSSSEQSSKLYMQNHYSSRPTVAESVRVWYLVEIMVVSPASHVTNRLGVSAQRLQLVIACPSQHVKTQRASRRAPVSTHAHAPLPAVASTFARFKQPIGAESLACKNACCVAKERPFMNASG